MRVASIGGGAMGGMFAARLAHAGAAVTVVDTSEQVLEAIRASGIQLEDDQGTSSATVEVATELPEEPVDLAIVFVKAQHTPAVSASLHGRLSPATTVASLQNGWGNADVLAGSVPPEQLVVGVTYHSCTSTAPGMVAHTGRGPTFVGPYELGGGTDRARRVAEVLTGAGIEATATDQIRTEIWKKLVLNVATLPVAALSGLPAGAIDDDAELSELVDALAAEAVAVAAAVGVELSLAERVQRIHAVLRAAGRGKPSMLQDVEGRRKSEVETVSGAVLRAAGEVGLEAPLNKAMVALVHGVERSWAL